MRNCKEHQAIYSNLFLSHDNITKYLKIINCTNQILKKN